MYIVNVLRNSKEVIFYKELLGVSFEFPGRLVREPKEYMKLSMETMTDFHRSLRRSRAELLIISVSNTNKGN